VPARSGHASFQPPARAMRRTWISTRLPTIAPRAGTPRQRRAASPGVRGAARVSIATSRRESARERRHRATAGRLSADPACLRGPPRHGAKAPAPQWSVAGAAVQPVCRTYSEDIDLDVRGAPRQMPGAEPWAPSSCRSMLPAASARVGGPLGALALGMGKLAAQSLIAGTGSRARGAPLPSQAASARLLAGPRGIGYRDDRCAT
jgi:hypothetical protein